MGELKPSPLFLINMWSGSWSDEEEAWVLCVTSVPFRCTVQKRQCECSSCLCPGAGHWHQPGRPQQRAHGPQRPLPDRAGQGCAAGRRRATAQRGVHRHAWHRWDALAQALPLPAAPLWEGRELQEPVCPSYACCCSTFFLLPNCLSTPLTPTHSPPTHRHTPGRPHRGQRPGAGAAWWEEGHRPTGPAHPAPAGPGLGQVLLRPHRGRSWPHRRPAGGRGPAPAVPPRSDEPPQHQPLRCCCPGGLAQGGPAAQHPPQRCGRRRLAASCGGRVELLRHERHQRPRAAERAAGAAGAFGPGRMAAHKVGAHLIEEVLAASQ